MNHDTTPPLWALLEARATETCAVPPPAREHGLARGGGGDLDAFAAALEAGRTRDEALPVPATLAHELGLARLSIPGHPGWALELVARDGGPIDALGEAATLRPLDDDAASWLLRPTPGAPCAVVLRQGKGLLLDVDDQGELRLRAVDALAGADDRSARTGRSRPWSDTTAGLTVEPAIDGAIADASRAEAEALATGGARDDREPEADATWPELCAAALRERHARPVLAQADALAMLLAATPIVALTPVRDALAAAPIDQRLAIRRASQRAASRLRRAIEGGARTRADRDRLALRRAALEAVRSCLAAVDGPGALERWLVAVDAAATALPRDAAPTAGEADALRRAEAMTAPRQWWLPALDDTP